MLTLIQCNSNGQDLREDKVNCYSEKLKDLQNDSTYIAVKKQFADTFTVFRNDAQYFGKPGITEVKIDDAVFFDRTKSKCLVVVPIKNNAGLMFGGARIVYGILEQNKWIFRAYEEYSFSNDYFQKYKTNSFENISSLARGAVLTDGNVKEEGCEIDENFWFKELKR
jgi:hypothetical protein